MEVLKNIPTNIITGFLGSGKTTFISHLLRHKPENERWAVLVNEFGTAGVDGGLMAQPGDGQEVFIREVPGGCLCCTAGLPAQMAINSLLARARPQRLIIEPTGLGHPLEILELLQSEHYAGVIDLKATLTLVDARKLQDPRYTTHDTFLQQLDVADHIIASKSDLYADGDLQALKEFATVRGVAAAGSIIPCAHGELDPALLDNASLRPSPTAPAPTTTAVQPMFTMNSPLSGSGDSALPGAVVEFPEEGYLTFENEGDGYRSDGWVFPPTVIFSYRRLRHLLDSVNAVRVKAVLITDDGIIGYNRAEELTSELFLEETSDSRIEIIRQALPESQDDRFLNADTLLACQLTPEQNPSA